MPGEETETPTAVAEPEVPSEEKPPDSEEQPKDIEKGVEGELPKEKEAEPEPEQPDLDAIREEIKNLPPELREAIIEGHAADSPHVQELLRRREQSAKDRITAEQGQREAQQQDSQRVLEAGKQAITEIGALLGQAEQDFGNAVTRLQQGEQVQAPRLDKDRLLKAVNSYRDAWVTGQAMTWNRELQETFLGFDPLTAMLTEEDAEKIAEAGRTAGRQGKRGPVLQAWLEVAMERSLQRGYGLAMEDMEKIAKRDGAVVGQREALAKLKGATPTEGPKGTPAAKKSYANMTDEERAKLTPQEIDAMTRDFLVKEGLA